MTSSVTYTGPNRRLAPRYSVNVPIEIEWGSALLVGRVHNISLHGALVLEMEDPLWIGAAFSARLLLDEPAEIDCVVRRVEPGRGIGISFTPKDDTARARIDRFLASLGQP